MTVAQVLNTIGISLCYKGGQKMRFGNVFKKNLLLFAVVTAIFSFCVGQSAFAGSIIAWGDNSVGKCNVPEPNSGFIAVAAGWNHSLGLKEYGSIKAWGWWFYDLCNVPEPNANFISIAAGAWHNLGLKRDGSIVAWGDNYDGQCNIPLPNSDFVDIAAGYHHSLGLKRDGSIVAWGDNYDGQCNIPSPNSDFIAIAAGGSHSLGLKQDGSIVAWGYNENGECNIPSPNADFIAIGAGAWHSLGLKKDGSIVGWGSNKNYDGNWVGQATPPAGNDFIAIATSNYYSLSLRKDGSIVGWGANSDGQCNVPSPNADFIAIAAGFDHSLAIKETGSKGLALVKPNGSENIIAGRIYTIEWQSSGSINQVLIEYSDSNGVSWTAVSPANAGNNRRCNWLVPKINSQECLVRITDGSDPGVSDVSDTVFTIYQCTLKFDVTGDCIVNMRDFALLASEWLQCGNPFDPNCLQ